MSSCLLLVFPLLVGLASSHLCLACRDGMLGPLTITVSGIERFPVPLNPGQPVHGNDQSLLIGPSVHIDLSTASLWQPALFPPPVPFRILESLQQIRRHLPPDVHRNGLGGYAAESPQFPRQNHTAHHAHAAIASVRSWLAGGMQSDCSRAQALLGLGPGLTPSGDDLLGGILIALHAIGAGNAARRLWGGLATAAQSQTHRISSALLASAAEGCAGKQIHGLIGSLLEGANLQTHLENLAGMGHSSGWDTLAGLVMVLEMYALRTLRPAA